MPDTSGGQTAATGCFIFILLALASGIVWVVAKLNSWI